MVPFDSGKSLHRVFALEIKRLRKIFFFNQKTFHSTENSKTKQNL